LYCHPRGPKLIPMGGDGFIVPFRITQWILAILHLGSAIAVTAYLAAQPLHKNSDWPVDVSARYNIWAAPGQLGPGEELSCAEEDAGCRIFTIEEEPTKFSLGYTAACFSFISGLHHLVVACAIAYPGAWGTGGKKKPYERYAWCLKNSVFPLRWLDYAVTSGLMFAVLTALFEAPISLDVVVLAFCFQFLVIVAGAGSEYIWSREPYVSDGKSQKGKLSEFLSQKFQPHDKVPPEASVTERVGWFLYNVLVYPIFGTLSGALKILCFIFRIPKDGFLYNVLVYSIFGTIFGTLSFILNIFCFIFLIPEDKLRAVRDITRKQTDTIFNTPHGLLFLCAVTPYVVVFATIFYKFYLATNADDDDNLVSITGIPVPKGIRTPPDTVWIAVLSIFVTFSSFAVCHINKISLANPKSLRDTIKYETIYSFLSFTSKIILLFNIFAGIVMRGESDTKPVEADFDPTEFVTRTRDTKDDEGISTPTLMLLITVSLSLVLGTLSYYYILIRPSKQTFVLFAKAPIKSSVNNLSKIRHGEPKLVF